jgi:DNA-binding transcriptional MerR regulator
VVPVTPNESNATDRRIGVLASSTGLSVRALRHYDEIGLLRPSGRSEAGHRLYSASDVERLYRIRLLRSLGVGLPEITSVLDGPGSDLQGVIAAHLAETDRRIDASDRLRSRLAHLLQSIETSARPERESPDFGLASPQSLGGTSAMVAVIVDDVDAHFRHAVSQGATVVYEPVDQPYGREWSARDPEGALWSFLKPIG